jgi:hypothetical protein
LESSSGTLSDGTIGFFSESTIYRRKIHFLNFSQKPQSLNLEESMIELENGVAM